MCLSLGHFNELICLYVCSDWINTCHKSDNPRQPLFEASQTFKGQSVSRDNVDWYFLRFKVPDACSYVYRICGGHDLQRCICFPQHLLKEGNDNGEERRWDELLCLPQHDVTCIFDTLCFCCWGPKDVDYWLEHSHSTTWQQSFLVPTFSFYPRPHFMSLFE